MGQQLTWSAYRDPGRHLAISLPDLVAVPETRYAKTTDGLHIAFQVLGDGPVDLVFNPGFVTHVEYGWEEPRMAAFLTRLASFSRLIIFDQRGTGLSDPVSLNEPPTLEVYARCRRGDGCGRFRPSVARRRGDWRARSDVVRGEHSNPDLSIGAVQHMCAVDPGADADSRCGEGAGLGQRARL